MRIVHASDWHGFYTTFTADRPLPPADVYVFTGDMLGNFPGVEYERRSAGGVRPPGVRVVFPGDDMGDLGEFHRLFRKSGARVIDPAVEARLQGEFVSRLRGRLRRCLGTVDAPVLLIRGNHDFIDYSGLFDGGPTHSVPDGIMSRPVVIDSVVFWLHQGVPPINGMWWGERPDVDLGDDLPPDSVRADVLVSHVPPHGLLDAGYNMLDGLRPDHFGSRSVRSYVDRRAQLHTYAGTPPLLAHLFGHVHEQGGKVEGYGPTTLSNAATTVNTLEIG